MEKTDYAYRLAFRRDRAIPMRDWATWSWERLNAINSPENNVDFLVRQHVITTPPDPLPVRHSRPIARLRPQFPDRMMMCRPALHAPHPRRKPKPQPLRLKPAKPTTPVEPLGGCIELAHRTITSPEGVRFALAHGFGAAA